MKSFYEEYRDETERIEISRNRDHSFLPHHHQKIEVLIVKKGGYTMTIGDERYEVESDCVAVVDEYEIHSYENRRCDENGLCDDCIVVFPKAALAQFNAWRKNGRVATPLIRDTRLCDELLEIVDKYMLRVESEPLQTAGTQLFLARLFEALQFTDGEKESGEGALARKILQYIERHYQDDCTRKEIARALGYTEAHISRVFHKYIRRGISAYVNERRFERVADLKRAGDTRTETELLYEAGFKSEQTYYRFKKSQKQKETPRKT